MRDKLTLDEAVDKITYETCLAGPCECTPNKHGEPEGECQTCDLKARIRALLTRLQPDTTAAVKAALERVIASLSSRASVAADHSDKARGYCSGLLDARKDCEDELTALKGKGERCPSRKTES